MWDTFKNPVSRNIYKWILLEKKAGNQCNKQLTWETRKTKQNKLKETEKEKKKDRKRKEEKIKELFLPLTGKQPTDFLAVYSPQLSFSSSREDEITYTEHNL